MPKIEIVALGATRDRKPVGEVGEVVDVNERLADAMKRYGLAKDVSDSDADETEDADNDANGEATGENPADNRETRDAN